MSDWTVWADGSGTTGGPAGVGFVAVNHSERIDGSLPIRWATSQQAELIAAAYALEQLPEGSAIELISDSQYLVRGWNEWLPAWRKRGWRKKTGGPPANVDHWQRLERAVLRHRGVLFRWTRGHVGTWGNEEADRLAGEAHARARLRA